MFEPVSLMKGTYWYKAPQVGICCVRTQYFTQTGHALGSDPSDSHTHSLHEIAPSKIERTQKLKPAIRLESEDRRWFRSCSEVRNRNFDESYADVRIHTLDERNIKHLTNLYPTNCVVSRIRTKPWNEILTLNFIWSKLLLSKISRSQNPTYTSQTSAPIQKNNSRDRIEMLNIRLIISLAPMDALHHWHLKSTFERLHVQLGSPPKARRNVFNAIDASEMHVKSNAKWRRSSRNVEMSKFEIILWW